MTNDEQLIETSAERGQPVHSLAFAPKDDGLVGFTPGELWHWRFDPEHPEVTLRSLFPPISSLRDISWRIAVAVAGESHTTEVADAMWWPEYVPYLPNRLEERRVVEA